MREGRSPRSPPWWVVLMLSVLLGITFINLVITGFSYGTTDKIAEGTKGYLHGLCPPIHSNPCSDGLSCTRDAILPDHTCSHRPYMDTHDCSDEDICYAKYIFPNQSTLYPKRCCQGVCVSNRSRCLGVCPSQGLQLNNASTCSLSIFPLNFNQFQSVSLTCLYGACTVLATQQHFSAQPLSDADLFNITQCPGSNPTAFLLSKCIRHVCLPIGNGSVLCVFRFQCATFNLGNNLLDSIHTEEDVSRLRQSQDTSKDSIGMPTFSGDELPIYERLKLNIELNNFVKTFNKR